MRAKYLLRIFPLMLFVFGVFKAYSATAIIYVDPVANTALPGEYFTINLNVANVTGLWGWECRMSFSPECLYTNSTMIEEGPFLKNVGSTTFSTYIGPQYIQAGCNFTGPDTVAGNGTLANITFYVVKKGASNFHLYESYLRDVDLNLIGHTTKDAGFSCVDDVAITSVIAYPTEARVGEAVLVNVTVKNIGNLTETFDVTTFYDNVTIGTQTVSNLTSSTSATLTFEWNTTGVAAGVYVISANTSAIPDEINITDNTLTDGQVTLTTAPRASFTFSPATPLPGETITFNASASYDLSGHIVSYVWDFGDGNSSWIESDPIAHHIYVSFGSYLVNLTVTDNDNLTDWVTHTVAVYIHDVAIISVTPYPTEVTVGQVVNVSVVAENQGTTTDTFDVSVYRDDTLIETKTVSNLALGTNTTLYFLWNTTGVTLGNYTIKAVATTVPGETDTTDNTKIDGTVTVMKAPVASFAVTPESPVVGEAATFDASSSTPNGGTIVSYVWDFGDGNSSWTESDPIAVHVYATFGNLTITLNITDSERLWDTESKIVTVRKHPVANFTFTPSFPVTGENMTFNATASQPNGGNITNYTWDFGDGSNTTTVADPIITHVYTSSGSFNATLTIQDSEGLIDIVTTVVTVQEAFPSDILQYGVTAMVIVIIVAIIVVRVKTRKSKSSSE